MNEFLILADINCLVCQSGRMMDGHRGVLEVLGMQTVLPSTTIKFYLTYFRVKICLGSFPISKNLEIHLCL